MLGSIKKKKLMLAFDSVSGETRLMLAFNSVSGETRLLKGTYC
jgi:hypothetical protein